MTDDPRREYHIRARRQRELDLGTMRIESRYQPILCLLLGQRKIDRHDIARVSNKQPSNDSKNLKACKHNFATSLTWPNSTTSI